MKLDDQDLPGVLPLAETHRGDPVLVPTGGPSDAHPAAILKGVAGLKAMLAGAAIARRGPKLGVCAGRVCKASGGFLGELEPIGDGACIDT